MLSKGIDKSNFLNKSILIISIIIVFILNNFPSTFSMKTVAIFVLIVDLYPIFKYRKNIYLSFVFIVMFYFDYSFIISKYLIGTSTLQTAYSQITNIKSYILNISLVFYFHATTLLFLNYNKKIDNYEVFITNNNENNKFLLFIYTLIIAFIIIDYLFVHLFNFSRTYYEYLLVLFVISFYYARNNKAFRKILFILMIISTITSVIHGARVISLQPMIAYFFIFYADKINFKKLILIFIIVIIFFTFAGLYGDFKDYGYDLKQLNVEYLLETIEKRKISLDTSISSYWTGMTIVESSNKITYTERIGNFVKYLTEYTILGTKANYEQLFDISHRYYIHYNGGYITSYFYYWLDVFGIFILGIYVSYFMNIILKLNKDTSDLKKIISIYFIASIPRWYLYFPTPLFRGLLLLIIIFYVTSKLLAIKRKDKANNNMEGN